MDATTAIAAGERAAKLVDQFPYQLVAVVFAAAFLLVLVAFMRQSSDRAKDAKETLATAKELATATHAALEVTAAYEDKEARREKRRRPVTNPGRREGT